MRIAVLGTGAMGSRMARRLLATGEHDVTVWNRTPEATAALAELGAGVARTPAAAAAGCDVVLSMLRDDEAVHDVWLGAGSALDATAPGAVPIDCSTVTPTTARELARRAAERGLSLLDAPVVGSRPQAEAGTLIFLVGGQEPVLRTVEPTLRQLGGAVHHLGPAGTGAQMKLLVNALFAVQVAAAAELLGGLDGTDLDPARAVEVLTGTPVAGPGLARAATAMLGAAFPAAFPVELVAKDLSYAVADAAVRQAQVPLTVAAQGAFAAAVAAGLGGADITGIAQLYRR